MELASGSMSTADLIVIDYGVGNLLSVQRAFEYCGANVSITSDPELIRTSPRVVLPGVGAFSNGMEQLSRSGIEAAIVEAVQRGATLLGICLGMQLLLDSSEEFGTTKGLGLIPGRVEAIPSTKADGSERKIPHIGWNELQTGKSGVAWSGTILSAVKPGDSVYFVHSYAANPCDEAHRLAESFYDGAVISAAIRKDNVIGCQFHPEKSGRVGLSILAQFLSL